MKSIWNGSINLGLVNIPVKLYSAIEPQTIKFRLLCGKCHTPIKYKRWCPKCKKEVSWQNTVKGFELSKGKYYILTKEKLEKLKPEKTDSIEIIEFVNSKQIDPIYFDKHYFVIPEKEKEKAYFLFKETLSATAKTAIGKIILKDKEHICSIESYKNGMLLTTLNYAYEIRDITKIPELKTAPRLSKEELKLAKQLINEFYEKEFDATKFRDTFAEKLKQAIKGTIKREIKKPRKMNLIKALKASINTK